MLNGHLSVISRTKGGSDISYGFAEIYAVILSQVVLKLYIFGVNITW